MDNKKSVHNHNHRFHFILYFVDPYPPESSSIVYYTSFMHLVLNLLLDGIIIDHFIKLSSPHILYFKGGNG